MEVLFQLLKDVNIPEDRNRKIFVEDDIKLLANSIESKGLMHAPVVQNDRKTLIAGERRYRAIQLLRKEGRSFSYHGEKVQPGYMPVVPVGELDEFLIREAELEENIRRVNLTWQEKSAATAQLHQLRQEQKGEVRQTYIQTSSELLGEDPEATSKTASTDALAKAQEVREDLLINAFANDPDVRKAKDRKDALKVVVKKLESKRREKLAEKFDLSKGKTSHTLINGDLFSELPKLESNSFACMVADPPYGINADKFRNQSALMHVYEDSPDYADKVTEFILEQALRFTKDEAHIYMFMDVLNFAKWAERVERYGFYVWRKPLIWWRGGNSGLLPVPELGPRYTYEAILYAIKGKRKTRQQGQSDVLYFTPDKMVERGAHKPISLYSNLISRSCDPGDKVIDPCCGAGPIFPAADANKCIATGIELDTGGYAIAVERLTNDGIEL